MITIKTTVATQMSSPRKRGSREISIKTWIPAFAGMTMFCCVLSKKYKYIQKLFSILLTLSIITGCGFHLRGSFTLPKHLQTIYITPDDPYEPLQKTLRRALLKNNIQIATSADKNVAILELTTPNFSESVTAFNSNGQAQGFKLTINFQYQVNYNNKILKPFTTIQSSRDIILTPNQILSGENERRMIKDDLLQESIIQLFRQLSTIPAP